MRIAIRARKMRKRQQNDRDKKEDFGIATGSNAKKENLNEEETPETENSENVPDSNDEGGKQINRKFRRKDPQKDQQGTFLIATDSKCRDFLKDYEFEDEEIPEDIPVLTDISVTWSRMRTGKMKVVSIIIFRSFRERYILAAGVELPEIEVSMDGGILCWHQQVLMILRIAVSSSTATHWNSIRMRLSRGSSMTNVILVSGVEATITISDLDIQIPIDNNADSN